MKSEVKYYKIYENKTNKIWNNINEILIGKDFVN